MEMNQQSPQFSLNKTDFKKVVISAFIFLAPALVVLLGSVTTAIPHTAANYVFIMFGLNVLTDIIRKFVKD